MGSPREPSVTLSLSIPASWMPSLQGEAGARNQTVAELVRSVLDKTLELSPRDPIEDPIGWLIEKAVGRR